MEATVLSYKIRKKGKDLDMDRKSVRKPEKGFSLGEEEGIVSESLFEDLGKVFEDFLFRVVFKDEEVPVSIGVEGSEVAESVGGGSADVVGERFRDTES